MAKRKVDPNVAKQLAKTGGGAVVTTKNLELPGGDISYPYAWYHFAKGKNAGKECWLPTDPWNVEKFTRRGLCQGEASPVLRRKYKNGEKKRDAAYDKTVAAFAKANPSEPSDEVAEMREEIAELKELVKSLIPD